MEKPEIGKFQNFHWNTSSKWVLLCFIDSEIQQAMEIHKYIQQVPTMWNTHNICWMYILINIRSPDLLQNVQPSRSQSGSYSNHSSATWIAYQYIHFNSVHTSHQIMHHFSPTADRLCMFMSNLGIWLVVLVQNKLATFPQVQQDVAWHFFRFWVCWLCCHPKFFWFALMIQIMNTIDITWYNIIYYLILIYIYYIYMPGPSKGRHSDLWKWGTSTVSSCFLESFKFASVLISKRTFRTFSSGAGKAVCSAPVENIKFMEQSWNKCVWAVERRMHP